MTDRQDIDALLVGALYGELDSSERDRLETHLSTHPEDRAALEALERTRAQVRRGIQDMPAAEPPPSLSALLLQEAASASRGGRAVATEPVEAGLWARFVDWLRPKALNPAYAGAFALMLVAGTATALYVRSGGKTSEPELRRESQVASGGAPAPQAEPPPEHAAAFESGAADAGTAPMDDYRVDLDRNQGVIAADKGAATRVNRLAAPKKDKPKNEVGYLEVEKKKLDDIDIKELPSEGAVAADGDAENRRRAKATATSPTMGGAGSGATAGTMQPQPDTAPADPKITEWAQTSHTRLRKLVADGKCPEAGRVGAEIKDKAPEYYAANIANDRSVRACMSYIEGQAKKKAAKDYKARSQQNTADEADVAPTTSH